MGELLKVSIVEAGEVSEKRLKLCTIEEIEVAASALSKEVTAFSLLMQTQYVGLTNIAFAQIMATFDREELIDLAMRDEETAVLILGKYHCRDKHFVRSALEIELESNFFTFLKEQFLFNSTVKTTESVLDIQDSLSEMINLIMNDRTIEKTALSVQMKLDIQPAFEYLAQERPAFYNHIVNEGWLNVINGAFTEKAVLEEMTVEINSITPIHV